MHSTQFTKWIIFMWILKSVQDADDNENKEECDCWPIHASEFFVSVVASKNF